VKKPNIEIDIEKSNLKACLRKGGEKVKKLNIEIDVEKSNLEESDIKSFIREAMKAVEIHVTVGRPVSEAQSDVVRVKRIEATHFSVRCE
jgi:hypothetical protein